MVSLAFLLQDGIMSVRARSTISWPNLVPEALRSGLTFKLNLIFEGRGVGKPVSVGKVVRFW